MTIHGDFNNSFIAQAVLPHFLTIDGIAHAGTVDATNYEALSGRAKAMYGAALLKRIDAITEAAQALAGLRSQVAELVEEQAMEAA